MNRILDVLIALILTIIFVVLALRLIEANTEVQTSSAIFIGLPEVHSSEETMNVKVGGHVVNNEYKGF